MSTMTLKPRSAPRSTGHGFVGLPQVNLLPPEVRAARKLRHLKQWLAVSLLLVLACIALLYAFASLKHGAAVKEFNTAQAEQVRLQEAAKKYAAVQPVLSDIQRTSDARTQLMSTDIVWRQYLDAIAAVIPTTAVIDNFNVTVVDTTNPAAPAQAGLIAPGVASITFSASVPSLPDSAQWIDALDSIPGFYGAETSSDTLSTNDTGAVSYSISSTVQVASSAFANRFSADATATAAPNGN